MGLVKIWKSILYSLVWAFIIYGILILFYACGIDIFTSFLFTREGAITLFIGVWVEFIFVTF